MSHDGVTIDEAGALVDDDDIGSTALALLPPERMTALVPTELFTSPEKVDDLLAALKTAVRAADLDPADEDGRAAIRSLRLRISKAKVHLDSLGKGLVEEWKKSASAVDKERKKIRDELDALRDEVAKVLEDYEKAEDRRITAHQDALASIAAPEGYGLTETQDQLSARIAHLETLHASRDWQEFSRRAAKAIVAEIDRVKTLLRGAQDRARAAAEEAERIVREADERRAEAHRTAMADIVALGVLAQPTDSATALLVLQDRLRRLPRRDWDTFADAAQVELARAEQRIAAALQVAQEREAAEQTAREAEAAARARAEAEATAAEAAQQAETARLAAEQRQAEALARAEQARIAGHESALARLRNWQFPFADPPSVLVRGRIAELEVPDDRDWQEFAEQATAAHADALAALRQMLAAAEARDVAERAEAERKRQEAAAEMAAGAKREQERQSAAAVERERQRVADEAAVADRERIAREKNKENRAKVNRAIVETLVRVGGVKDAQAKAIATAIAKGEVPNVAINY